MARETERRLELEKVEDKVVGETGLRVLDSDVERDARDRSFDSRARRTVLDDLHIGIILLFSRRNVRWRAFVKPFQSCRRLPTGKCSCPEVSMSPLVTRRFLVGSGTRDCSKLFLPLPGYQQTVIDTKENLTARGSPVGPIIPGAT